MILGFISKFLLIWLSRMLVTGYNYDRIIIWDKPWYVILIKAWQKVKALLWECLVEIVLSTGWVRKLFLILCFLWTRTWLWWLSREELGVGIWGIVSLTDLRCGRQRADSGDWDNNSVLSFLTVVSSLCSWWLLWFGRSNKVVGLPDVER